MNFNKLFIFGLLAACFSCSQPNNHPPKQPDIKPIMTNTAPTNVTSSNIPIVNVPVIEEHNNIPDGWEKIHGTGWYGYAPISLESYNNDDYNFLAAINIGNNKMLFSVSTEDSIYSNLESFSDDFKKSLLSTNDAKINDISNIIVNDNTPCIMLEAASTREGSTLLVDIYLFIENETSYAFSCGSDSFTNESKLVCKSIVDTLVFY